MYPDSTPLDSSRPDRNRAWVWALALAVLVLLWFFGLQDRYSGNRSQSALEWLWCAWNAENDFEHGPLFPLIIGGLLWKRFQQIDTLGLRINPWGILVVLAGAFLYLVSYRTFQPRIAIGALPVLLWGSSLYLWGWKVAKHLFLPLFYFWLAIPVPAFQQATNLMQMWATQMAHHGSAVFGVETVVKGNEISSLHGRWEPLEIAKGCSGIRSLMALLMISGAWACVAPMAFWKRGLLLLSAVPLAILGNALRVTSIFVIAEYGDADWARNTWHDWSGLLLFYPISLTLLFALHSILEGGLPWKKTQRPVVRHVVAKKDQPKPFLPDS